MTYKVFRIEAFFIPPNYLVARIWTPPDLQQVVLAFGTIASV
jgi:hypothetical protein